MADQERYSEKLLFHQHLIFKSKCFELFTVGVLTSGRKSMENIKDTQDFKRTLEDPRQLQGTEGTSQGFPVESSIPCSGK